MVSFDVVVSDDFDLVISNVTGSLEQLLDPTNGSAKDDDCGDNLKSTATDTDDLVRDRLFRSDYDNPFNRLNTYIKPCLIMDGTLIISVCTIPRQSSIV